MNGNSPVLALKGVSKSFGPVQALTDVDFEVHAGEVVALVGDNGAGKSTLVKAIAGIHGADEGQILFEGQEVKIASPTDATALGIATVYQDLALCDNLDVVENLFLGRERIGEGPASVTRALDETGMEKRTGELLEPAGGHHHRRPRGGGHDVGRPASAGGHRSLAARRSEGRAARRADGGAGRSPDRQVLGLIKRLREEGHGVVVISHNLADVFEVADRIFVLRLGRYAGDFQVGEATQEEIVAAITGAEFGRRWCRRKRASDEHAGRRRGRHDGRRRARAAAEGLGAPVRPGRPGRAPRGDRRLP